MTAIQQDGYALMIIPLQGRLAADLCFEGGQP